MIFCVITTSAAFTDIVIKHFLFLASLEEKSAVWSLSPRSLDPQSALVSPSSSSQAVGNSPAGAWVAVLICSSETSCGLTFSHISLILYQSLCALVTFDVIPTAHFW